jgi:phosphoglycerate dehydrogenase-like enzyme
MNTPKPDVVVLRRGTEGLPMSEYGDEIQSRLPDQQVVVASTPAKERTLLKSTRVATGISISEDLLAVADKLELFVVASSGYDHLPLDALTENGVAVVNASGIHAPGIAEQVVGNMLVFSRRLYKGWEQKQRHEWHHYQANELTGKTVTLVGLGSINQTVVKRLSGFDVETIGVRYTPEKGGPADEIIGFEDQDLFHDALARTDYLVLASPITDLTYRIVDGDAIASLPPDAVVINVGRGGLVDTDALTRAVQLGNLHGAALDVADPEPLPPEHPLWRLDTVLITPHMGGHTPYHWPRLAEILARNFKKLNKSVDPEEFENIVHTG